MAWLRAGEREEGEEEEGADVLRYTGLESVSVRGAIGTLPCRGNVEAATMVVLWMRLAILLLMWKIDVFDGLCLLSLFSSLVYPVHSRQPTR